MSQLTRKIKNINKKINAQDALLERDYKQLSKNPNLHYLVAISMLSGFTAGFIYSKKRTLGQVVGHIPPLMMKFKKHSHYLKLIRLFLY